MTEEIDVSWADVLNVITAHQKWPYRVFYKYGIYVGVWKNKNKNWLLKPTGWYQASRWEGSEVRNP